MQTIIIAACNDEDTSWTQQLPSAFSNNGWIKSVNTTNKPQGREAYVYLDYIVGHYDNFSRSNVVVFCQGNPFNHDPEFLSNLQDQSVRYYGKVVECSPSGMPHCDYTPLHAWSDVLKLPLREDYKFVAGAMYRLTGERIKKQTKEFYQALLYLTMIPNNKSAWVLERLWPVIWELDL